MNTKQHITRAIAIFTALTIAGISMVVTAQAVTEAFAQTVLVAIGSAIFGAGLAFFLVRISTLTEK
jgi:hypothetical protein